MAEERTYNIPLRREWLKVPRYKRTKKAVSALREFIVRHMKVDAEKVKIGKSINNELWKHGIKNPPHHIKVIITKDDEGKVTAEVAGAKKEEKAEKKEAKETVAKKPEVKEKKGKEKTEEKAEKEKEKAVKVEGAEEAEKEVLGELSAGAKVEEEKEAPEETATETSEETAEDEF